MEGESCWKSGGGRTRLYSWPRVGLADEASSDTAGGEGGHGAEANSDTPANPGSASNTTKLFPHIPRAIGPNVNLPLNAKMRNAILGHRPPKAVTT
jgi:hypothetical protein